MGVLTFKVTILSSLQQAKTHGKVLKWQKFTTLQLK
jgi:hypothetical protein